ncbi:MAG: hypothetical protein ABI876_11480, partial [Bacteroidota bacterium]
MAAQRKHKHWNIRGESGYIRGLGSGPVKRAFMRFGDKEVSLGFAFTEENKARGLQILREEQQKRKLLYAAEEFGLELPGRLRPRVEEKELGPAPEQRIVVSLHAIAKNFLDNVCQTFSKDVVKHYQRAIGYYLIADCEWDMLDENQVTMARMAINKKLLEAHKSRRVIDNTLDKYYTYINKFFQDYVVAPKYLDLNPVIGIPRPHRNRESLRGRWLPEEVEVIVFWMERIQPSPIY